MKKKNNKWTAEKNATEHTTWYNKLLMVKQKGIVET